MFLLMSESLKMLLPLPGTLFSSSLLPDTFYSSFTFQLYALLLQKLCHILASLVLIPSQGWPLRWSLCPPRTSLCPLPQLLAQSKGQIIMAQLDEGIAKPHFKMHLIKKHQWSLCSFVGSLGGNSLAEVLYRVRTHPWSQACTLSCTIPILFTLFWLVC